MRELTAEELVEWKRIITDLLREFHQICKENGLRYFACGGTAIGAVRHHGIIPWDDDIDVSMPRPDYDRLVEVCKQRDMGDYELSTPYNTDNYGVPFMKLCNRNTTLIEISQIPCLIGVYIDIFPLDGTSENRLEAENMMRKYQKLKNQLEAVSCRSSFLEHISLLTKLHEWGRFLIKTKAFFCRNSTRKSILSKIDHLTRQYPFETSKHVAVFCGSYGMKEIMPKSFCGGVDIPMPFENITVMMPSGYDEYLTRIYGDYMQLPPKEKRISHHFHAVVDLTRRLTKEEAKSRIC